MYKLDSGLISIIATIVAIIATVYSAINKKQKEKAAKKTRVYSERKSVERCHNEIEKEDEDDFNIFNNPFEELLGITKKEVVSVNEMSMRRGEVEEDELFSFVDKPIEKKSVESNTVSSKADEFQYCNGMESVENAQDFYKDGMTEATAFVEMTDAEVDVIENEEIGAKNENMERRSAGKDLKGRLKLNPQDVIIFSEILKPKYQDF